MQPLNGYVKIYRKLLSWGWYSNSPVKDTFIHFLLTANFKDMPWQNIVIERGQLVTSYPKLAESLGFTVQQIRTAILKLKSTGEITVKTTNKFQLVTVVNFEDYQSYEDETNRQINTQINRQITDNQQTNNRQITDNQQQRKNDKNIRIKEDKKYIYSDSLSKIQNEELKQTLNDFIDMRKTIKKPLTGKALNLIISKLDTMANDDSEKILILEQSIMSNWQGIFPLKDKPITVKHEHNDADDVF